MALAVDNTSSTTPVTKRKSTFAKAYEADSGAVKRPRNRADHSIEHAVAQAIYDNVRDFTAYQLDSHLNAEGCRV
eukprot:6486814-Amphidinium_carterae.4